MELYYDFFRVLSLVIVWAIPAILIVAVVVFVIGAPVIILLPAAGPLVWIPKLVACFGMLLLLQITVVGYYLKDTNPLERVIAGIGAAALITFIVTANYIPLAVGLSLGALLTLWQLRERRLLASAV